MTYYHPAFQLYMTDLLNLEMDIHLFMIRQAERAHVDMRLVLRFERLKKTRRARDGPRGYRIYPKTFLLKITLGLMTSILMQTEYRYCSQKFS